MTEKKMKKAFAKYSRGWMESELQTFAQILVISETSFLVFSEKLALKMSANNEYLNISETILSWKWITKKINQFR